MWTILFTYLNHLKKKENVVITYRITLKKKLLTYRLPMGREKTLITYRLYMKDTMNCATYHPHLEIKGYLSPETELILTVRIYKYSLSLPSHPQM